MGEVAVGSVSLGARPESMDGERLSVSMRIYLSHLLYWASSQFPLLRQNPPSQVAAKVPEKGRLAEETLGMVVWE
jgi:hypothetical protein